MVKFAGLLLGVTRRYKESNHTVAVMVKLNYTQSNAVFDRNLSKHVLILHIGCITTTTALLRTEENNFINYTGLQNYSRPMKCSPFPSKKFCATQKRKVPVFKLDSNDDTRAHNRIEGFIIVEEFWNLLWFSLLVGCINIITCGTIKYSLRHFQRMFIDVSSPLVYILGPLFLPGL